LDTSTCRYRYCIRLGWFVYGPEHGGRHTDSAEELDRRSGGEQDDWELDERRHDAEKGDGELDAVQRAWARDRRHRYSRLSS
jgi:hypothetical protein